MLGSPRDGTEGANGIVLKAQNYAAMGLLCGSDQCQLFLAAALLNSNVEEDYEVRT